VRVKRLLFLLVLAACPKHGDNPKATDKKHDAGAARLLDTDGGQALQLPPAPPLPAMPHGLPDPPSVPRPEDVALGELLFYDARISTTGKVSCASCHAPEHDFAGARDTTAGGQPNLRRTPTIENLVWATALGWDGRYATLADQLPAHAKGQLGEDLSSISRIADLPLYAAHFARVGGADPAHAVSALVAFVTTRYAGDAPWDTLETEPRRDTPVDRGYALFNGKAQCATCHAPPLYTDNSFHRLGLIASKDDGRGRVDPAKAGAFKTPSLRGATKRTSFFHDASATIDWHLAGGTGQGADAHIVDLKPIALSPTERTDLVAYVAALTSTAPPPAKPPLP
jgi:cytochrome c peroxidase